MKSHYLPTIVNAVVCLMLLGIFTGCATVMGSKNSEPIDGIDTQAMRAAGYNFDDMGTQKPIPTDAQKPSVVLEVRDGKRHMERIPMTPDKPLFIQDVIHDAKLEDKLGQIKVSVLRPTGDSTPPIRMEVDMERGGKGVVKWQNYALQPGDQIVVSKDTSTWMDGVMSSVIPSRR
ncbi:MAG: hypothetical protein NTW52_12045 [Planctomycetota bacterium]|nr:hypothetical protein [Planctomycetota bacterium]